MDYRKDAKVLLCDLEVSPSLSWAYGQYQTNAIKVEKPPILLSFAWKWLGEDKVKSKSIVDMALPDKLDHTLLVKELWKLFDEANVIVTHNIAFDVKMANAFFLRCGLNPPSPYKTFCTLKTARKYFKLDNNRLDYLGNLLFGEGKTEITNADTWYGVLFGNDKERKRCNRLLKKYNCLTPDHKVLTTDLRWTEIGSLEIGDTILGFEEEPSKYYGRRFRKSTVLGNRRAVDDVYKVTLSNGDEIKCTKDHKWLCTMLSKNMANRDKRPGGKKWLTTEQLVFNGKKLDGSKCTSNNQNGMSATVIQKLIEPVEEENTKEAGWLAGMFDGEGSLYNRSKNKQSGIQINISQKDGQEFDKIGGLLKQYNDGKNCLFDYSKRTKSSSNNLAKKQIYYYNVGGGFLEQLNFLAKIRPERLIGNIDWSDANLPRMEGRNELVYVENIEYIGKQEIVILETDTRTYIADGYAMHNCQDVILLEKIYERLLAYADNHPNMALCAGQYHICPRCGKETVFHVKTYRRTGVQVTGIQYQCSECGGYVTRKLTAEEKEELAMDGRLLVKYRNIGA